MKPREAMRQADAAFAGKLVKVVPRGRSRVALRYRVRRVIKSGPGIRRGRLVTVLSPRGGAACGLPARTGRSYGLMLSRGRGFWSGGLCGLLRGYRRSGGCAS